jgi:hypothetical protein
MNILYFCSVIFVVIFQDISKISYRLPRILKSNHVEFSKTIVADVVFIIYKKLSLTFLTPCTLIGVKYLGNLESKFKDI